MPKYELGPVAANLLSHSWGLAVTPVKYAEVV